MKKVYAGRFRQQMLGNKVFFADDVLRHDDRRHDVVGDDCAQFLAAVRDFQLAEIGLHPAAGQVGHQTHG